MGYPNDRRNPAGAIPIYIVPTPTPGPPWPNKQDTGAIPINMVAAPTTAGSGAIPVYIATGPNLPDAQGRWPNDQAISEGAIPCYNSPIGMPVWDAGAPPVGVPINIIPPIITPVGPAIVGTLLSVSTGLWTNNPTSYFYGWRRNGATIPGSPLNTYTTVAADVGTVIDAIVQAMNSVGGGIALLSSNQISVS
jgi:hypothetical protein